MKLPRNVKIFRGQLDSAPFASVLFIMVIFMTLNSTFVFTPGVRIDLPRPGATLPGTRDPTIVVAVDSGSLLFFENTAITEGDLIIELKNAVRQADRPLTLEIQADRSAKLETAYRLFSLAGEIGFKEALWVSTTQPLPPVIDGVVP